MIQGAHGVHTSGGGPFFGLVGRVAAPIIRAVAPRVASKIKFGGGKGDSVGKGNPTSKAKPVPPTKPSTPSKPSGRPAPNPACSLVPGTAVLMADGTHKPIDELEVGDKVLATDPETGKTTPQTVLTTYNSVGAKQLVTITIDTDGKDGTKTGTLTATDNHPFWLPNQKQWKNAGDLKPGMWLRTSAGTHAQITAVKTHTAYQRVHNLTLDTDHTYYVEAGTTPVLVHNCGEQVRYGSTELSQAILEARVLDGAKSANTYAAARYEDPAGGLRTLVANSDATGHAEQNMVARLAELGVSPSAVKQLYVEYQPCIRCGANWVPQFDNAEVTWSFVWNSDKAVQAAARKDRAAAIKELWGK